MADGKIARSYLEQAAGRFESSAGLVMNLQKLEREIREMSRKNYKDIEINKFKSEGMARIKAEYAAAVRGERERRENVLTGARVKYELEKADPKVLNDRSIKSNLFKERLGAMSKEELAAEAQAVQMRKETYYRSPDEFDSFTAELRRRGLDDSADLVRKHLKQHRYDEPYLHEYPKETKELEMFEALPPDSFPMMGKNQEGKESWAAGEITEKLLSS